MKQNIQNLSGSKKIIFLIFILSLFSISSNTALAKSLDIFGSFTGQTTVGKSIPIAVRTSDKADNSAVIHFNSSDVAAAFSPNQCTVSSTGACSTNFRSSKVGVFAITITAVGYDARNSSINVSDLVPAKGGDTGPATYTFLAPLSKEFDVGFNPTPENALGTYLNMMIKIIIGLAAIAAVIMITMGGIQYMTTELISSKEEGKDRIKNALLGLLLLLGSYTILFTINPDLLNTTLKIDDAKIYALDEPEVETAREAVRTNEIPPTGPVPGCEQGLKKAQNGTYLCDTMVQAFNDMLTKAKSEGLTISGGGYRSLTIQRALRVANCQGNYADSKAQCEPPTALPGQSNHNKGLAVDFTCDGSLIEKTDNKCFLWLQKNARTFGFLNFAKEPWHWSVDGK